MPKKPTVQFSAPPQPAQPPTAEDLIALVLPIQTTVCHCGHRFPPVPGTLLLEYRVRQAGAKATRLYRRDALLHIPYWVERRLQPVEIKVSTCPLCFHPQPAQEPPKGQSINLPARSSQPILGQEPKRPVGHEKPRRRRRTVQPLDLNEL